MNFNYFRDPKSNDWWKFLVIFAVSKRLWKKKFKNLKNAKSPNNFTFQLKKKKIRNWGGDWTSLFLPPLDTMSGEVKWQRSVGPYFGYRCSTSVVVKVVVARKWRQDKSIIGVQQNPSERIDRDSVFRGPWTTRVRRTTCWKCCLFEFWNILKIIVSAPLLLFL